MLQRYLLLWLILTSGLAFVWNRVLSVDPWVALQPLLPLLVAVTMFSVGWVLPRVELLEVRRRWPLVLYGTAVQYTVMPLLAYLAGYLFQLPPAMKLGVLFVGCVPGAMASNVLTLAARGHVSYSLCLTASATLLSPLIVPGVMLLLLEQAPTGFAGRAMRDLTLTVVLPVVAGHLSGHALVRHWPRSAALFEAVANLAILAIIAAVVALNRDRLASVSWLLIGVLGGINLLGFLAGNTAARFVGMQSGMRRALTLEIGMQNAGVGVVLAGQMFPDQPAALIPPALYTFGCMLTGTALANFWSRRPPAE